MCRVSSSFVAALMLGAAMVAVTPPARGDIMASANITSKTGTFASYHYDLTLNNEGDVDISTLWYAWDDSGLNFLPHVPQHILAPNGWYGFYTYDYLPAVNAYTYGIEWYNYSGSPVPAGRSLSGFSFESADSPSVLSGTSNVPPLNPDDSAFAVSTTFAYMNYPPQGMDDPGVQFVASVAPLPVPEPAGVNLFGAGMIGVLLWRRCGPAEGVYHRKSSRRLRRTMVN
jgi:hypothetical protein